MKISALILSKSESFHDLGTAIGDAACPAVASHKQMIDNEIRHGDATYSHKGKSEIRRTLTSVCGQQNEIYLTYNKILLLDVRQERRFTRFLFKGRFWARLLYSVLLFS